MKRVQALSPAQLRWHCAPEQFAFETTQELPDLQEIVGQARAVSAIEFGIGMQCDGYNLYILGPPGLGKRSIVSQYLKRRAIEEPTPPDWCYINHFDRAETPVALQLPPGRGRQLKRDMENLVEDLRSAIPAALQSEEHRQRLEQAQQQYQERHDSALAQLEEKARQHGLKVVRTPEGVALAPMRDEEVISPQDFEELPDADKQRYEEAVEHLQADVQAIVEQLPLLKKKVREKVKELNRTATRFAIGDLLTQLKSRYEDLPEVGQYLNAVEVDVVENAEDFRSPEEEPSGILGQLQPRPSFRRYEVNLLVDNSQTDGAPVVYEIHPTYHNLMGRAEYQTQMGALVTDFTLIKPGALHRANGGYLVVHAHQLLQQPYAWEGLKRALRAKVIRIESLGAAMSLVSTVSLQPTPIPLEVKLVLLGERSIYYMLHQYDPDFSELFKVPADFDDQIDCGPAECQLYGQLIATLARRENSRPLDRAAVARVIEHCARMSGDSEKLSTHMRTVSNLLREADYWAARDKADVIRVQHVDQTIDQQVYRADRLRERLQEEMRRGTILIDTQGEQVGQVNGLSVIDMGNLSFGRPSRITATARLGNGKVIDIEREVELGGALHSKGVLILSSFLASRYAQDRPLSLSASLVFEQSYGMVDGDSASLGELCALLSALGRVPIRQGIAVTGSVNQHGVAQAIGGVNEKIEGFFDVCRVRGLTGDQGVLIPAANVKHLMLRRDVVEAAVAGQFHVFAVETIDEAISVLTGSRAGQRDDHGQFPPDTVNQRVEARLHELSRLHQTFAAKGNDLNPLSGDGDGGPSP